MNLHYLDFEQPIADLEEKIEELRLVSADKELNIQEAIESLEHECNTRIQDIFSKLSTWDIARLSRHPKRPYTLDYIHLIFDDFDELHGDRTYADDASIVGGLARLEGRPVMVIGHQKGREVKEKVLSHRPVFSITIRTKLES